MPATRYSIDLHHKGLNKFRQITGTDWGAVHMRAEAEYARWEGTYQRQVAAERKKQQRERDVDDAKAAKDGARAYKEARKEEAAEASEAAQAAIELLGNLLLVSLDGDARLKFASFKRHEPFAAAPSVPPVFVQTPPAPVAQYRTFVAPEVTMWKAAVELVNASVKAERLHAEGSQRLIMRAQDDQAHQDALMAHHALSRGNADENARRQFAFEQARAKLAKRKAEYEAKQADANRKVDEWEVAYRAHQRSAIEVYCECVVEASQYPDEFPCRADIEYRAADRMLLVNYRLPSPADMPKVKSVKYVISSDSMNETELAETKRRELYEKTVHQVMLRTLHELFQADTIKGLQSVVVNGVVETIDPATGRPVNVTIAAVHSRREDFEAINLGLVKPKDCLRGMGAKLSSRAADLEPVKPIHSLTGDTSAVEVRNVAMS